LQRLILASLLSLSEFEPHWRAVVGPFEALALFDARPQVGPSEDQRRNSGLRPARWSRRVAGAFVGDLLAATMATGTVKSFNPQKGYGFMQPQGGGGKDVFVHISRQ
jgi:hypothetical protein